MAPPTKPRPGSAPTLELTSFVGRQRELGEVKRCLERSRLVCVTGQGGVGKTRLTGRLARERRRAFVDGIWWVELASVTEEVHVVAAVASVLGVDAASVEQLAERARNWTALVILDNCEHLANACAHLVKTLLERCPDVRVLATSRQRLGVPGELVYELLPMPVAQADRREREGSADAVTLFVDRAQRLLPDFDYVPHLDTIGEICMRLDGLPLAIELAAAWLPVLAPDAILQRLDEPLRLLTQDNAPDAGRHRSLSESIEWSYDLCTPDERKLWRYLSPFVGGCSIEAVEFVAFRIGVPREETLAVLGGLVRKSVVAHTVIDGVDRYTMLVALRDFGLATLDAESASTRAYRSLLAYYVEFFQRAEEDWFSPRQAHWLAHFARELPNVRQALEFALTAGQVPRAVFSQIPLWRAFWLAQGRIDEIRVWLARAIAQTEGDDEIRMLAELLHAYAVGLVRGTDAAMPLYYDVRARAERSGMERVLAYVDSGISALLPDGPEAIALSESFLRFARKDPQMLIRSGILVRLALIYDRVGDTERARQLADEVITLSEASGERYERGHLMFGLGANALARGDLDRAVSAARQSLELRLGIPANAQTAYAIDTIAAAAQRQGDSTYAATLVGVADAVWHSLGGEAPAYPQVPSARGTTREALLTTLGTAEFDRLHEAGRRMPLADALRFAIDPRDTAAQRARDHVTGSRTRRAARPSDAITRREVEVAELVAQGMTDNQIAAKLVISPRTAQGHVQKALVKLGLSSRTQLAIWVTDGTRPAR